MKRRILLITLFLSLTLYSCDDKMSVTIEPLVEEETIVNYGECKNIELSGKSLLNHTNLHVVSTGSNLSSSKIDESIKEYDSFLVSNETMKREGFISNVDVEYHQFYLSNTLNESFKDSLKTLNHMVLEKIFYEDLIAVHSDFFEAKIRSDVMIFDEKIASVFFEGYLNDNGYYHEILSSVNYDLYNGRMIDLHDVIKYEDLIDLITISDLEIYPVVMETESDMVKETFIKQITNMAEEREGIDGFYLTEEHIVLYTHLGQDKDIHIALKVPFKH